MTGHTITLNQAIKRVRKHFRDSMDDQACEAFEFLADRVEERPAEAVFLGVINGVPVGLLGTEESVKALESHIAMARDGGATIDAKYDDVLLPFARLMARELHANAGKGDRPGWLRMSAAEGMLEIYYHTAKLQKAVKNGEGDRISEYAADVANMAMMLLDMCGGLDVSAAIGDSHE